MAVGSRDEDRNGLGGGKIAYFDELVMPIVIDPSSQLAGLEAGEYDFIDTVNEADVETLSGNSDVALAYYDMAWLWVLVFNGADPLTGGNLGVRQAIQAALRGATEIPIETLRACADALVHARVVADYGNRSAESDAGVAIGLLKAAAAGAAANVRANLGGLKDEGFKSATEAETARLLEPATLS